MRQWQKAQAKTKRIAYFLSRPSRFAKPEPDLHRAAKDARSMRQFATAPRRNGRTIAEIQEQSVRLRNVPITLPRVSILETAD